MTKKKTEGKENIKENEESIIEDECVADKPLDNKMDEDIDNVPPKSENELLQDRLSEEKNNYLRLLADFDNFRKRMTEQALRMRQDGIAYAIEVIFPVLDSMDRAISCVDEANKEGIMLIKKQFDSAFKTLGVEEITEVGIEFDPNIHHAVMRVEDSDNSGKVLEVFQKGYKIKDNVIRCAMVKVAE